MEFTDRSNHSTEAENDCFNSEVNNKTPLNEWEYDDILEKIGFGKTQWILLLISGLLTITSIAAQQSMGIIMIASQCEFNTTQSGKGVMIAVCVAGIFISTYFWGYISDDIGRRKVLLWGIFSSNLMELVLMFITNIWIFNILNFFIGISLGGVSASLYAYLSEFNKPRDRAVAINFSTMFVSVAAIYTPATAWLMLSLDWSIQLTDTFIFLPWRLIILFNLLPGLIGGLLLLLYPSSPKLLLILCKNSEAIDAVEWICKFNTGKSIKNILNCDYFTLKPEPVIETNSFKNLTLCGRICDIGRATLPLFRKQHGPYFIIAIVTVFGMFFSSNGLQYWFPEIVNRSSGSSSTNEHTVCYILDKSFAKNESNLEINETTYCDNTISTKTHIDNIIIGTAFLIGFLIQGTLLNPCGRKNVLLGALILSTLSGILLHFVTSSTFILILFCLYILLPGLSISIMLGAVVDLVPTNLRGKAVSLCMTLGRLGIIVATNLMGILLEPYCNTTFAIFTFTMLVCGILVHFLPIENSV